MRCGSVRGPASLIWCISLISLTAPQTTHLSLAQLLSPALTSRGGEEAIGSLSPDREGWGEGVIGGALIR
jgi:hypothetical protein